MVKIALAVAINVLNVMLSTDVFHVVNILLEMNVNYVNRATRKETAVKYILHIQNVISYKLIQLPLTIDYIHVIETPMIFQ